MPKPDIISALDNYHRAIQAAWFSMDIMPEGPCVTVPRARAWETLENLRRQFRELARGIQTALAGLAATGYEIPREWSSICTFVHTNIDYHNDGTAEVQLVGWDREALRRVADEVLGAKIMAGGKPKAPTGRSGGNKHPKRKARTTPTPDMNLLYELKKKHRTWGYRRLARTYNELPSEKKKKQTISQESARKWLAVAIPYWAHTEQKAEASLSKTTPKVHRLKEDSDGQVALSKGGKRSGDRIRQKF